MLTIKQCTNEKGDYLTIINHKNHSHCHSLTMKEAKKIEKCFYTMKAGGNLKGFSPVVRKKTMRLVFGCKIC